jgi:pilus assembly protein TadC
MIASTGRTAGSSTRSLARRPPRLAAPRVADPGTPSPTARRLPGVARQRRASSRIEAPGRSRRLSVIAGLSAALVAWLIVGGIAGLAIGIGAAVIAVRVVRRIEPAEVRRARAAAVAELPFAADLLAAALRSGVPMERAIRTTGEAVGGPLGQELVRVADGFGLGLEAPVAWAGLRAMPGADRMADVAIRSVDSGAALARTLERLADDLRSARTVSVEAAAQRVGVLIVLPLGLCFLPAFVLAGIVPVIVAVLGDVLR